MFRFLKIIIFLTFLFALALAAKLYFSSPEERAGTISWIKSKIQPVKQATMLIQEKVKSIDLVRMIDVINQGEGFQQIINCGKTKTLDIEDIEETAVYRWVDDSGQVHFSDQAPGASRQSEKMNVHFPDKKRYFNLNIIEDTDSLPVFTHDRVSADVRQIYGILSRDLKVEHLRQVILNVRIIGNQDDFQRYKDTVAPEIKTNLGFYTSKNNEAVVYQGHNAEAMRSVVRHEASHVILAGLYGVTPVWFNEGLAEYFEQLELTGQARIIKPASYHLEYLNSLIDAEQDLHFVNYMSLSAKDWYGGDLRENYALAWSLVYFLMSSEDGKQLLQAMMNSFAEEFCSGLHAGNYIEKHYSGGMVAFEADWRKWLMSGEVLAHRY